MVTLLVIFLLFIVIGLFVALITGIIAISPALLVVLALLAIDVLFFKWIFRKRKKEKK